jgi:hypothetical protein
MQTQSPGESPAPSANRSAYQILTDAQELIRDPKYWTRRGYARDAHGAIVGPRSASACCWCGAGAILKVGGGQMFVNGSFREDLVEICKGEPGIVHTSDDKGHTALMSLFDRLREKAKALEVAA